MIIILIYVNSNLRKTKNESNIANPKLLGRRKLTELMLFLVFFSKLTESFVLFFISFLDYRFILFLYVGGGTFSLKPFAMALFIKALLPYQVLVAKYFNTQYNQDDHLRVFPEYLILIDSFLSLLE